MGSALHLLPAGTVTLRLATTGPQSRPRVLTVLKAHSHVALRFEPGGKFALLATHVSHGRPRSVFLRAGGVVGGNVVGVAGGKEEGHKQKIVNR